MSACRFCHCFASRLADSFLTTGGFSAMLARPLLRQRRTQTASLGVAGVIVIGALKQLQHHDMISTTRLLSCSL